MIEYSYLYLSGDTRSSLWGFKIFPSSAGNGITYLDNFRDSSLAKILFRFRTQGTPVTAMDISSNNVGFPSVLSGTGDRLVQAEAGGNISGSNTLNNNFKLGTAGNGFYIKEGTNACMGVATLAAGTVVVNTTKVTASSRIFLTIQSLGTVAAPKAIGVTARTAATSFTITSADATDTSVIAWQILEPA